MSIHLAKSFVVFLHSGYSGYLGISNLVFFNVMKKTWLRRGDADAPPPSTLPKTPPHPPPPPPTRSPYLSPSGASLCERSPRSHSPRYPSEITCPRSLVYKCLKLDPTEVYTLGKTMSGDIYCMLSLCLGLHSSSWEIERGLWTATATGQIGAYLSKATVLFKNIIKQTQLTWSLLASRPTPISLAVLAAALAWVPPFFRLLLMFRIRSLPLHPTERYWIVLWKFLCLGFQLL